MFTGDTSKLSIIDGILSNTSSSTSGDIILEVDLTGDFIITFDEYLDAGTRCGICRKSYSRTYHFDAGTNSNGTNQKYIYYTGTKETESVYKNSTPTDYIPCKIIKEGNNLSGYMNDQLVVSINYDWISTVEAWNFHTVQWVADKTIKVKNFKIKLIPYKA